MVHYWYSTRLLDICWFTGIKYGFVTGVDIMEYDAPHQILIKSYMEGVRKTGGFAFKVPKGGDNYGGGNIIHFIHICVSC